MSDESKQAELLRAAGFMPSRAKCKDGAWQRADLPEWVTTDVALAFAAVERAREDARLLATLASGFAAQGRHPVECAVYARETFKSLYGRESEIVAQVNDAAAKVARVESLLASVDGGVRATLIPTEELRAALFGEVTP